MPWYGPNLGGDRHGRDLDQAASFLDLTSHDILLETSALPRKDSEVSVTRKFSFNGSSSSGPAYLVFLTLADVETGGLFDAARVSKTCKAAEGGTVDGRELQEWRYARTDGPFWRTYVVWLPAYS